MQFIELLNANGQTTFINPAQVVALVSAGEANEQTLITLVQGAQLIPAPIAEVAKAFETAQIVEANAKKR